MVGGAAYDSQASARAPKELLAALSKNAKARTFYATLNRANLYAIVYRLQTAKKPETKAKRLKAIVDVDTGDLRPIFEHSMSN